MSLVTSVSEMSGYRLDGRRDLRAGFVFHRYM